MFIIFAVFNQIEYRKDNERMNNQEILDRAVTALNSNLLREKAWIEYCNGVPFLTVMGSRFRCVVEPYLSLAVLTDKVRMYREQREKNIPVIYVTLNASAKMQEFAKQPEVNVLDCAGNFNIQYQQENGDVVLMLANKGEKRVKEDAPKNYPIFGEKGLKVIFFLLQDKKNIKLPYREIVHATGVAIGTVKNVIDGMKYHQFVRIERNKRFLINTDRLLSMWAANYVLNLRPKLPRARFAFRNEAARSVWKEMKLPEGMVWGGETAASLIDGFLTPGKFTIYSDAPAAALMKTGVVIPAPDGEITVYQKFWRGENDKTVPAVLVYADLMYSSNSRCMEAAEKIKENELKYLFR